jgi:hypothetical protein
MSAFEHIIVLLSFVYALALTHLLSGVAYLIRAGKRVRFSSFHAGWMLNALLVIIADWIGFWDMRRIPRWSMGTILFVMGMAIANYLQAALVCPEVSPEGPVDLIAFHREQGRRYIAASVASVLFALLANVVLGSAYNLAEWTWENMAVIPMLAACVLALAFRARWAQILALASLACLWAVYFTELQQALS